MEHNAPALLILETVDIESYKLNIELRWADVLGGGRLWIGNEIEPDDDS